MKEKKSKRDIQRDDELPERRNFLVRAGAVAIGGFVGLFPLATGLAVFFDPLRRKSRAGEFVKVATLDDVPSDGTPRPFSVVADRIDAWNYYPQEPIGAVYLRRTSDQEKPQAVTATCPHLGCFVDYNAGQGHYHCPCHDSSFEADGSRIRPESCPAPRDLDSLEVEVRGDNEVWVRFEKFVGGKEKKTPEA
jgi:menaquinol-cytochrome c reductase iron-sulfur subunit